MQAVDQIIKAERIGAGKDRLLTREDKDSLIEYYRRI